MSYDPKRKKGTSGIASRAMSYAHSHGISLKSAWKAVRGADPKRKTSKHRYSVSTHKKVYHDSHMTKKKSSRRRHDPARFGGGRGILGKLMNGTIFAASAVVGTLGAKHLNAAVPQASLAIPGTGKAVNLVSFFGGAALSGFGPHAGMMGNVVQGFAGGVAGGSDPVGSMLGGGAVRNMGPGLPYGSIGV